MGKGDTHTKKHIKNKFIKHELVLANKEGGEFYAKVQSILNGNRIKVKCVKGDEYQVIIRNIFFMTSKKSITFPDADRNDYWILVSPGISKNQYFLQHIYTNDDYQKLQSKGEITTTTSQINTIQIGNIVEEAIKAPKLV